MLLYYITDRRAFAGTEAERRRTLLARIAGAARAGVDYIQLREKDLASCDLERLAGEAVRAVRENSARTRLLINGRADVALAWGADGVHLPAEELAAFEIRALWRQRRQREPVIGVSAHSATDVRRAQAEEADFAVLAPIFEKGTTPGIGLDALRAACAGLLPASGDRSAPSRHFAVLALGGVNLTNARACLDAGAAGVAGIRLFQLGDVFDTVLQLRTMEKRAEGRR